MSTLRTFFDIDGDMDWIVVSSNTNVANNKGYIVDTSTGAVTLTLPASPVVGDVVGIKDLDSNFGTNNLTIARNGKLIDGAASNKVVNLNGYGCDLIYSGETQGWVLSGEFYNGIPDHIASTSNPHSVTKTQVGLGNADNTSDINKPISTATQDALNLKLDSSAYTANDVLTKVKTVDGSGSGLDADLLDGHDTAYFQTALGFTPEDSANKNALNGYAGLTGGKVAANQLPAIAITDTFVVGSQALMLALTAETGDVAVRTDLNKSFILQGTVPSTLSHWQELLTPTDAVQTISTAAPITTTGGASPTIGITAATTSANGAMSAADKTKLDGIAAGAQVNVPTDLSLGTISETDIPINSSTGSDVLLQGATTSLAGIMTAADKTKLDAIVDNTVIYNGVTVNTATTIVSVFLYNTANDSDGGAWRARCQAKSWYNESLNTATRGADREFPAVALIVAEDTKLTIFDATKDGYPMWMVFNGGGPTGQEYAILGNATYPISSVFALNGTLCVTNSGTTGGLSVVNFISDVTAVRVNSTTRFYSRNVLNRNIAVATTETSFYAAGIISRNVNDVTMTVMPTSAIDTLTGLPVPTVVVATAAGVSIIDGSAGANTVVNSSIVVAFHRVVFVPDTRRLLLADKDYYYVRSIDITGIVSSGWTPRLYRDNTIPTVGNGNNTSLAGSRDNTLVKSSSQGLVMIAEDTSTMGNSMAANITTTYNTGWMKGDIRRAFICDALGTTEPLTFPNLITNGTFDTATTGWSPGSGTTLSIDTARLKVTGTTGSLPFASQAITTVAGKRYTVSCDFTRVSTYNGSIQVGTTAGAGDLGWSSSYTYSTNIRISFIATGTTTYISVMVNDNTIGANGIFDNITTSEFISDRSIKNSALLVTGTVWRGQVNSGSDLQYIGGFNNANYLSQPYSADLDFGTGDFHIALWLKEDPNSATELLVSRAYWTGSAYSGSGYAVYVSTAGQLGFQISDDGFVSVDDISSTGFVDDGLWKFIVAQRVGTKLELWANGVKVNNDTTIANALLSLSNTSAIMSVGINGSMTTFGATNASISLLRIGAGNISSAQIARIYADELPMFQPNVLCVIQGTNSIGCLAYDKRYNTLIVGGTTGIGAFRGLVVDEEYYADYTSTNIIDISSDSGMVLDTTATTSRFTAATNTFDSRLSPDIVSTNIGQGIVTATTVPLTSSTGTGTTLGAATTSLAGLQSAADKTKLDGIAAGAQVNVATDLTTSRTGGEMYVYSSTGTDITLQAAATTLAGVMTSTDKTKLDGIAAGAQVNVPTHLSLGSMTSTNIPINSSTGNGVTLTPATTSIAGLMSAADKVKVDTIAGNTVIYDGVTVVTATTIVDVFLYNTENDSDGGAWRARCQQKSWYNEPLNTATRGADREFPAIALIVAEQDKITIFDATKDGNPMWMVFNGNVGGLALYCRAGDIPLSSVTMLNGQLVTGSSGVGGLTFIDFLKDLSWIRGIDQTRYYSRNIARRGDTVTYIETPYFSAGVINSNIISLAMVVIPTAPVDSATGLQTPTIAVGTAEGLSIIDGPAGVNTVVDISGTDGNNTVSAVSLTPTELWFSNLEHCSFTGNTIPSVDYSSTVIYAFGRKRYYPTTAVTGPNYLGTAFLHPKAIVESSNDDTKYVFSDTGLSILQENTSSPDNGMVTYITDTYNTGWMKGDVRRALMCEALGTTDTIACLVSSWTNRTGSLYETFTTSGKDITSAINTTNVGLCQTNALGMVVGKSYTLLINLTLNSGTAPYVSTGSVNFVNMGDIPEQSLVNGLNKYTFTYTGGGNDYLYIYINSGTTNFSATVLLNETIADRCVKYSNLSLSGTLSRTPVATGADLQRVGPFAAANYLSQAYSADLDFGTGDFYVMGWINKPTTSVGQENVFYRIYAPGSVPTGPAIVITVEATGLMSGYITDNAFTIDYDVVASTKRVDDQKYHQFAFIKRGSTLEMWIDGVLDGTIAVVNTGSVSAPNAMAWVGHSYNASGPLNGYLSMFRIGAGNISTTQMPKIYREELPLFQVNTKCTLPDSTTVKSIDYDDRYNTLTVGTTNGGLAFRNLVVDGDYYVNTGSVVSISVDDGMILDTTPTTSRFIAATNSFDSRLSDDYLSPSVLLAKIKTVDGSGSGLDADLLEGLHSTSFLRSDANNATLYFNASNGVGVNYWGIANTGLFGSWMSASTDGVWGGRITGDTTSDYNIYNRISGAPNRGFVFETSYGSKIMSINPTAVIVNPNMLIAGNVGIGTLVPAQKLDVAGKVTALNGYNTGSFDMVYNSTTQSLDFNFIG